MENSTTSTKSSVPENQPVTDTVKSRSEISHADITMNDNPPPPLILKNNTPIISITPVSNYSPPSDNLPSTTYDNAPIITNLSSVLRQIQPDHSLEASILQGSSDNVTSIPPQVSSQPVNLNNSYSYTTSPRNNTSSDNNTSLLLNGVSEPPQNQSISAAIKPPNRHQNFSSAPNTSNINSSSLVAAPVWTNKSASFHSPFSTLVQNKSTDNTSTYLPQTASSISGEPRQSNEYASNTTFPIYPSLQLQPSSANVSNVPILNNASALNGVLPIYPPVIPLLNTTNSNGVPATTLYGVPPTRNATSSIYPYVFPLLNTSSSNRIPITALNGVLPTNNGTASSASIYPAVIPLLNINNSYGLPFNEAPSLTNAAASTAPNSVNKNELFKSILEQYKGIINSVNNTDLNTSLSSNVTQALHKLNDLVTYFDQSKSSYESRVEKTTTGLARSITSKNVISRSKDAEKIILPEPEMVNGTFRDVIIHVDKDYNVSSQFAQNEKEVNVGKESLKITHKSTDSTDGVGNEHGAVLTNGNLKVKHGEAESEDESGKEFKEKRKKEILSITKGTSKISGGDESTAPPLTHVKNDDKKVVDAKESLEDITKYSDKKKIEEEEMKEKKEEKLSGKESDKSTGKESEKSSRKSSGKNNDKFFEANMETNKNLNDVPPRIDHVKNEPAFAPLQQVDDSMPKRNSSSTSVCEKESLKPDGVRDCHDSNNNKDGGSESNKFVDKEESTGESKPAEISDEKKENEAIKFDKSDGDSGKEHKFDDALHVSSGGASEKIKNVRKNSTGCNNSLLNKKKKFNDDSKGDNSGGGGGKCVCECEDKNKFKEEKEITKKLNDCEKVKQQDESDKSDCQQEEKEKKVEEEEVIKKIEKKPNDCDKEEDKKKFNDEKEDEKKFNDEKNGCNCDCKDEKKVDEVKEAAKEPDEGKKKVEEVTKRPEKQFNNKNDGSGCTNEKELEKVEDEKEKEIKKIVGCNETRTMDEDLKKITKEPEEDKKIKEVAKQPNNDCKNEKQFSDKNDCNDEKKIEKVEEKEEKKIEKVADKPDDCDKEKVDEKKKKFDDKEGGKCEDKEKKLEDIGEQTKQALDEKDKDGEKNIKGGGDGGKKEGDREEDEEKKVEKEEKKEGDEEKKVNGDEGKEKKEGKKFGEGQDKEGSGGKNIEGGESKEDTVKLSGGKKIEGIKKLSDTDCEISKINDGSPNMQKAKKNTTDCIGEKQQEEGMKAMVKEENKDVSASSESGAANKQQSDQAAENEAAEKTKNTTLKVEYTLLQSGNTSEPLDAPPPLSAVPPPLSAVPPPLTAAPPPLSAAPPLLGTHIEHYDAVDQQTATITKEQIHDILDELRSIKEILLMKTRNDPVEVSSLHNEFLSEDTPSTDNYAVNTVVATNGDNVAPEPEQQHVENRAKYREFNKRKYMASTPEQLRKIFNHLQGIIENVATPESASLSRASTSKKTKAVAAPLNNESELNNIYEEEDQENFHDANEPNSLQTNFAPNNDAPNNPLLDKYFQDVENSTAPKDTNGVKKLHITGIKNRPMGVVAAKREDITKNATSFPPPSVGGLTGKNSDANSTQELLDIVALNEALSKILSVVKSKKKGFTPKQIGLVKSVLMSINDLYTEMQMTNPAESVEAMFGKSGSNIMTDLYKSIEGIERPSKKNVSGAKRSEEPPLPFDLKKNHLSSRLFHVIDDVSKNSHEDVVGLIFKVLGTISKKNGNNSVGQSIQRSLNDHGIKLNLTDDAGGEKNSSLGAESLSFNSSMSNGELMHGLQLLVLSDIAKQLTSFVHEVRQGEFTEMSKRNVSSSRNETSPSPSPNISPSTSLPTLTESSLTASFSIPTSLTKPENKDSIENHTKANDPNLNSTAISITNTSKSKEETEIKPIAPIKKIDTIKLNLSEPFKPIEPIKPITIEGKGIDSIQPIDQPVKGFGSSDMKPLYGLKPIVGVGATKRPSSAHDTKKKIHLDDKKINFVYEDVKQQTKNKPVAKSDSPFDINHIFKGFAKNHQITSKNTKPVNQNFMQNVIMTNTLTRSKDVPQRGLKFIKGKVQPANEKFNSIIQKPHIANNTGLRRTQSSANSKMAAFKATKSKKLQPLVNFLLKNRHDISRKRINQDILNYLYKKKKKNPAVRPPVVQTPLSGRGLAFSFHYPRPLVNRRQFREVNLNFLKQQQQQRQQIRQIQQQRRQIDGVTNDNRFIFM